jgi:hypothetical protein
MKKITTLLSVVVLLVAAVLPLYQNQSAEAVGETIQTLDYLTLDGKTYIDTGIDQIGDIKTEVDLQFSTNIVQANVSNIFGTTVGAVNPDNAGYRIYKVIGATYLDFDYGDYNPSVDRLSRPVWGDEFYERATLSTDNNKVYYNGTLIVDSTEPGPTQPLNIFLGTANVNSNPSGLGFQGNIYSFKIWKSGVLMRDFVPAARYICGENATVEYGFIDRANGDQWYGNLGTGTLTGSPAVADTACPVIPPTPTPEPNPPIVLNPPNTGVQ